MTSLEITACSSSCHGSVRRAPKGQVYDSQTQCTKSEHLVYPEAENLVRGQALPHQVRAFNLLVSIVANMPYCISLRIFTTTRFTFKLASHKLGNHIVNMMVSL